MPIKRVLLSCRAAAFASLVGYGAEQSLGRKPGNTVGGGDASIVRGQEPGLLGYWKLHGDCRDYSGHGNHGVNHGVNLDSGAFDGISAHIEVPSSASLKFGIRDFALCA